VELVDDGVGLEVKLAALSHTGTIVVGDSLTYPAVSDVAAIHNVELLSSNRQRPLVRLPNASTWSFVGANNEATLVLDGLFVSGGDLLLDGTFGRVTVRFCTLDPGTWNPDASPPAWRVAADGRTLGATRLRVRGSVRELVIERSITGPIFTEDTGRIGTLRIADSIIQAADPDTSAIALTDGDVDLQQTTLMGPAEIHRLHASASILHDVVRTDDRQHGCVRFSVWASGSELPRKYQSIMQAPRAALFCSQEFGRPDYAQLHRGVEKVIAEGTENGSEMGAFAREANAIKERSLLIKYQEYLPLGIEPLIIHVT